MNSLSLNRKLINRCLVFFYFSLHHEQLSSDHKNRTTMKKVPTCTLSENRSFFSTSINNYPNWVSLLLKCITKHFKVHKWYYYEPFLSIFFDIFTEKFLNYIPKKSWILSFNLNFTFFFVWLWRMEVCIDIYAFDPQGSSSSSSTR